MTVKDIFLHLRFTFSLFLMPIYWFAVSQQLEADFGTNLIIFIVLHIFIYPASNAYNSYFDKDETSIGGLENPPKVDRKLWKTANYFDALGILIAFFFIGRAFGLCVMLYIAISRAYSYTGIRLKKYAIVSWLIVGLFQGALVFLMVYSFGQHIYLGSALTYQNIAGHPALYGAIISALILWAVYPITQIYQHESDAKNGDNTMSRLLGKKGTFIFTIVLFSINLVLSYIYLPSNHFRNYLFFSGPIALFMFWWFWKVLKDEQNANFSNTMKLNALSSVLLNICFILNTFS